MLNYREEHRTKDKHGNHVVMGELTDQATCASVMTKVVIDRYGDAPAISRAKYGHLLNPIYNSENKYLADVVTTTRRNPFATLLGMTRYVQDECKRSADIQAADISAIWTELEDTTGRSYTFSEFKSHLLNHVFRGDD